MEFSVLGPVRGWHDQHSVALGGRQRRCVLAVLLLRAGQVVPLDRMVELIWDDRPPEAVRNAVQTHVSRLRRALACDPEVVIEARPPGYVCRVPPQRLDLNRFRLLVGEAGRTTDAERSGELLRDALAQWQGRPLADVLTNEPLRRLSAGLEEERLAALRQRLCLDLRLGRHSVVVDELAELVAGYPMREGLAELWILALYRCGRQADALAELRRIRARTVAELGVEPGPALRSLHQRILRADPTLDPPKHAQAAGRVRTGVPALLPADVAGFTGRGAELAELDTLLRGGGPGARIAAVSGTAGVGKTALAVHWAHRVRSAFPDGQLYVDLRGYDPDRPMTTVEALTRLLDGLGVSGPCVPVEMDAMAGRYRTELADRRVLVVLDNALSVEQVRALVPGTSSCVVVVTSRDSLAGLVVLHGARRLGLAPLPVDEAMMLLRRLIGERATDDPAAVRLLAELGERLPLALRVTAELAAGRPDTPLALLAEELRDGRRRLSLLDAGGDLRAAVRAVLSWSYRHLPADAARLFRGLGCHPGRDVDRDAAAAIAGSEADEAARLLDTLVRAHVVHVVRPGRYGMHDLLRAYATELAETTHGGTDVDDPRLVRGRLFDHYLAAAGAATDVLYPVRRSPCPGPGVTGGTGVPSADDLARAREWLDVERGNLVAVCGHAAAHGWPSHAVRLAATLNRYLEAGHYADALTVHRHALAAAGRLGDERGQAHALTDLGLVHRLLGRYAAATEHLRQALDLHRRTGDLAGEARALSNLGIVEDRLGRGAAAAEHLTQALTHHRQLADRHGIAAVLTNLGGLHCGAGRFSLAADHLAEALVLFRELGDRGGEASALTNLAQAETGLLRHHRAVRHLERALVHFRELDHRYGQAVALANLGLARSRLGQHDQAIDDLGEALVLFRDTGHRYGEASVLNGLAEVLHEAARPGALAHHLAALDIATETGDHDEQARAHAGAARLR